MKPNIVIVHKDENSAYGMSFPDAPGCFSAASSLLSQRSAHAFLNSAGLRFSNPAGMNRLHR